MVRVSNRTSWVVNFDLFRYSSRIYCYGAPKLHSSQSLFYPLLGCGRSPTLSCANYHPKTVLPKKSTEEWQVRRIDERWERPGRHICCTLTPVKLNLTLILTILTVLTPLTLLHPTIWRYFLWSPYVTGQTIIFSSCFFLLLLFSLA